MLPLWQWEKYNIHRKSVCFEHAFETPRDFWHPPMSASAQAVLRAHERKVPDKATLVPFAIAAMKLRALPTQGITNPRRPSFFTPSRHRHRSIAGIIGALHSIIARTVRLRAVKLTI
jgi:hypothetical protein